MQDDENQGRKMLDEFISIHLAKRKSRYYPSVPWDIKNFQEILEFYGYDEILELVNYYLDGDNPGTAKHFCNNIQEVATAFSKYSRSKDEFNRLMHETQKRMTRD